MTASTEDQAILRFLEESKRVGLGSTGATMVPSPGNLYNVGSSTNDPKHVPGHEGQTWKNLLIALNYFTLNSTCNITNPGAAGSHNNFSVGGHMTVNPNNTVTNGTCYLMPECYWHNSTSRNNLQYTHTNAQVAQLTGYLQGEHVATFKLRLPTNLPFALLFKKDGAWDYRDLTADEAANVRQVISTLDCTYYALIERVRNAEEVLHITRSDNMLN